MGTNNFFVDQGLSLGEKNFLGLGVGREKKEEKFVIIGKKLV